MWPFPWPLVAPAEEGEEGRDVEWVEEGELDGLERGGTYGVVGLVVGGIENERILGFERGGAEAGFLIEFEDRSGFSPDGSEPAQSPLLLSSSAIPIFVTGEQKRPASARGERSRGWSSTRGEISEPNEVGWKVGS